MKKLSSISWRWVLVMLMPMAAFAEEAAHGVATGNWSAPLGVCLGMGLAVFAGASAQGRIGAAYMEGISRNPSAQPAMFTPFILALAFVEAMILVTFVVVCIMGKF